MRQTITGIYLNHFSYSETSVILKLFTKEYGVRSFVIKGAKKRKGGMVLQPFHFIEVTSNFNPDKDLNFANTVKLAKASQTITLDIRKSTVAIFITEVLYKIIKEEELNEDLYGFLSDAIEVYDKEDFNQDFHLLLLKELTRFIGIIPSLPKEKSKKYFNLEEGVFEWPSVISSIHLNEEDSQSLMALIGTKFDAIMSLNLSSERRMNLLNGLIRYFEIQLHLKRGSIKSHKILHTVFAD